MKNASSIINNEPRYSDGDIYYYHGDHLGNILAIWDATNKVTCQRTFYYASGLPMQLDGDATLNGKLFNALGGRVK